ncbi:MAG: hypothetical protein JO250_22800 [Armatimonadetes bacterium]|nr:hypothetical protein [Armatimonadota bacterium]
MMTLTSDVPATDTAVGSLAHEPQRASDPHRFAPATRVEIIEERDGYFLIGYDRHGRFAGDSWFGTVEEAKSQARQKFGVDEADWRARTEEETPIFSALVKRHFAYLINEYGFAIIRDSDWVVEFATASCLVTVSMVGVRLESREREIIRRRRAELLTLISQDSPHFQLPPRSADDPKSVIRDADGSQNRRLGVLAPLLKKHGEKMLCGDFSGQKSIAA